MWKCVRKELFKEEVIESEGWKQGPAVHTDCPPAPLFSMWPAKQTVRTTGDPEVIIQWSRQLGTALTLQRKRITNQIKHNREIRVDKAPGIKKKNGIWLEVSEILMSCLSIMAQLKFKLSLISYREFFLHRIEDGKSCTNVSDWKAELLWTFSPANSNVAWNELFIWHFKRYQMHIMMHTDVQWKANFKQ